MYMFVRSFPRNAISAMMNTIDGKAMTKSNKAPHELVDDAAEEPADQAEQDAAEEAEDGRDEGDLQVEWCRGHRPCEHVAAELVGAEPVAALGPFRASPRFCAEAG